jgi:hypothetical protein
MKKHYRHENDCLNCGTILEGRFCHNCGQENLQIKESFGHMMNHAISDYFHFDHQFFHTLKPLLFKPGFLTNEYMAGRRAQYLHPVKMYIFISVVYFLLLFQSGHKTVKVAANENKPVATQKVLDTVNKKIAQNPDLSAAQKKALQQQIEKYGATKDAADKGGEKYNSGWLTLTDDSTYRQYLTNQQKLPEEKRDGMFESFFNKKVFSYKERYGSRAKDVFEDEFKHNIPKMMFLMLPLFALILKVAFRNNKKFYVENLIYSFHLHCFIFIFLAFIMLLQLIIPQGGAIMEWIDFASTLFIVWYIYRSLRVVYQRSRLRTVTKIIGIAFMYFFVFVFCVTVVLLITAVTAA